MIIMDVGTDVINTVITYQNLYVHFRRSFNLKLLWHYTGKWLSIILRLITCCSQEHSCSSDAFVEPDCNRAARTRIVAWEPLKLPSSIFQVRRDIRSCAYTALEIMLQQHSGSWSDMSLGTIILYSYQTSHGVCETFLIQLVKNPSWQTGREHLLHVGEASSLNICQVPSSALNNINSRTQWFKHGDR